MKNCALCDSTDLIEKVEGYILCNNFGMGFRNPTDKLTQDTLYQDLIGRIKMLKLLFPNDDDKTTALRYSLHEHRTSEHPINDDGYCQFCETNWYTMSADKFKELLGYEKAKWIEERKI